MFTKAIIAVLGVAGLGVGAASAHDRVEVRLAPRVIIAAPPVRTYPAPAIVAPACPAPVYVPAPAVVCERPPLVIVEPPRHHHRRHHWFRW